MILARCAARSRLVHGVFVLAALFAFPAVRADEAATNAAAPAANDYSQGFAKYYAMGLPNVRDAKYVKLDVYSHGLMLSLMRLHELPLEGNAWLLEEAEDSGRFVVNPCRVCEVHDFQKTSRRQAKDDGGRSDPRSLLMGEGNQFMGQWTKADLEKDVAKTVQFLEEKIENRQQHDWTFRQNGYGTFLLIAIHYHARGYAREANRIADLLFEHSGDYRKVLVEALSVLASAQYDEACDRFAASGDWAAYQKDVNDLLARFPAGWDYGRAVKRVGEAVQKRLEQPTPPPLAGEGLTDEDRKLADELAEAGPFVDLDATSSGYRDFFVFPLPGSDRADHPLARLRARGVAAVPLLLAMLKDDYLLRIDTRRLNPGSMHYSIDSRSSAGLSDEEVARQYATMRRPAARSDLAARWLQPLPITGARRRHGADELDKEELYEEVRAWYAAHKDKSPAELARLYLAEGGDDQKSAAMQYLVEQGTESDFQAVEKHLLELADAENVMMGMSLVSQYAGKRGAAAKPFVEQYEARVRARGKEEGGMVILDERADEQMDRFLKNLRQMVSAEPLDEILEKVAGGDTNAPETSLLWHRLAQEKPADALGALLRAAPKAKDGEIAAELLGMTMMMSRPAFFRQMSGRSEDADEEVRFKVADHADLWRAVLADARPAEEGVGGAGGTVGDTAAYAIEILYGEGMPEGGSARELGPRAGEIMRKRAEARLEGKSELPGLPSADHVSAERKNELGAIFSMGAPGDVPRKLKGLTLNELLALADLAEEDDALNDRLRPASLLVRDVRATGLDEEAAKAWKASIGKPFGIELARRALEETRASVEAGVPQSVQFVQEPLLGGVVIVIRRGEPDRMRRMIPGGSESSVAALFQLSREYGHAAWPAKSTEESPDGESEDEEYDEDRMAKTQADFWEQLEGALREGADVCSGGQVRFMGAPAEKKAPEAEPEL